jgi:hypothetical protein
MWFTPAFRRESIIQNPYTSLTAKSRIDQLEATNQQNHQSTRKAREWETVCTKH